MKINSLFESYKISYDFTKKVNSSSVTDFLSKNEIPDSDVRKAVVKARALPEFQKILDLGYENSSSSLQEKRGTFFFTSEDGNSQVTCYVTGQARYAQRGGFSNSQFIASPIKTLSPTQVGDLPTYVEVMVDNLKKSFTSVLQKFEKRANAKDTGIGAVDARMKKLGFPDGFRIYLESALKNDKYITMDEGQVMINAKAGGNIGSLVIDFGPNGELGPNVDIGEAAGIWKVILRGENIKSYKGFEKVFRPGMIGLVIDSPKPNLKELAKIMTGNNIRLVQFRVDPLSIPLMSLPKICHEKVSIDKNGDVRLLKDKKIEEVLTMLNKTIAGELDLFDLQNELLDLNYEEVAKE